MRGGGRGLGLLTPLLQLGPLAPHARAQEHPLGWGREGSTHQGEPGPPQVSCPALIPETWGNGGLGLMRAGPRTEATRRGPRHRPSGWQFLLLACRPRGKRCPTQIRRLPSPGRAYKVGSFVTSTGKAGLLGLCGQHGRGPPHLSPLSLQPELSPGSPQASPPALQQPLVSRPRLPGRPLLPDGLEWTMQVTLQHTRGTSSATRGLGIRVPPLSLPSAAERSVQEPRGPSSPCPTWPVWEKGCATPPGGLAGCWAGAS